MKRNLKNVIVSLRLIELHILEKISFILILNYLTFCEARKEQFPLLALSTLHPQMYPINFQSS